MQEPDNLVIYNITKKMAQLARLTSELTMRTMEMGYQKEVIAARFDSEFESIRNHYESTVRDVTGGMETERTSLLEEIREMFEKRFESMTQEFEETKKQACEDIEREKNHVNSEVVEIVKAVSEVQVKVDGLVRELEQPLTDINESITGGGLANIQMKHQQELSDHDEKSEMKFRAYENETREKMSSLDETYRKAVENLKKQFMMSSKQISDLEKYQTDMRARCKTVRASLDGLRKGMVELEKAKANMEQKRAEGRKLGEDQRLEMERQAKLMDELTKELEMFAGKEDGSATLGELRREWDAEISDLEQKWSSLRSQHECEYEERTGAMTSSASLSKEQLDAAKTACGEEMARTAQEHEKEKELVASNTKRIEETLTALKSTSKSEVGELKSRLATLKDSHVKEKAALSEEMKAEKTELAKRIEDARNMSKDVNKSKDTLKDLEEALETMKQRYEEAIKEINESLDHETMELNDKFLALIEHTQKQNEDALEKIRQQGADLIQQRKSEYEKSTAELRERIRTENEVSFTKCRKAFEENGEIGKHIDEYKAKLAEMNNILKLMNENVDREAILGALDNDIKTLSHEKEQRAKAIEAEGPDLKKQWENAIASEETRHRTVMESLATADYHSMLEKMRSSGQTNLEALEQEITDLRQYVRTLESVGLGINARDFTDDSEVKQLTKSLEDVRNLLKQRRHAAQKKKETDIQDAQQRNAKAEKELHDEITDYTQKIEELANSFEGRRSGMSAELETLQKEAKESYNETRESMSQAVETLKQKLIQRVSELRSDVESATHQNTQMQSHMNAEWSEKQEKLDSKVSDLESRTKSELDSLRKRLEDVRISLEKLLETATLRRDDAKQRAQNKPMREEERIELERLQNICDLTTKQLTAILKDAMAYRSRMKQQEETINQRFGGPRQIAVLKSKQPGEARSKSNIVKRNPLPPLQVET